MHLGVRDPTGTALEAYAWLDVGGPNVTGYPVDPILTKVARLKPRCLCRRPGSRECSARTLHVAIIPGDRALAHVRGLVRSRHAVAGVGVNYQADRHVAVLQRVPPFD